VMKQINTHILKMKKLLVCNSKHIMLCFCYFLLINLDGN
jgi:hypothetical protein